MKRITTIQNTILVLFLLFIAQRINAQLPHGTAGDHTAVMLSNNTNPPNGYYEYLPTNFDLTTGETYPLVLFFHGRDEKGNGNNDLNRVLKHGPPKLIENGTDFPAIVISAQSPKSSGIFSSADFTRLYNFIINNYPIDLDRVYITGLSAGGGSTWNALRDEHTKIAAAVPICGTTTVTDPSVFLQQTPIWTHHNFNDPIVRVGQTITNMNRIANIGVSVTATYPFGAGNTVADDDYTMQFNTSSKTWSSVLGVKAPNNKMSFTLYKNGSHDAWTKTYNNQEVWDWLFAQNRNNNVLAVSQFTKPSTIQIYPNPTSGNITINNLDNSKKKIEIYNTLGQKLYDHNLTKNLSLNMSIYESGIYFAKVKNINNIETSIKIVVSKH